MAKIEVLTIKIDGVELDIGDQIEMDAYGEINEDVLVENIHGEILKADENGIWVFVHDVGGHKVNESAVWMDDDIVSVRKVVNE
jgi:hypothetical protein